MKKVTQESPTEEIMSPKMFFSKIKRDSVLSDSLSLNDSYGEFVIKSKMLNGNIITVEGISGYNNKKSIDSNNSSENESPNMKSRLKKNKSGFYSGKEENSPFKLKILEEEIKKNF